MRGVSLRLTHKISVIGIIGVVGVLLIGGIHLYGEIVRSAYRGAADNARTIAELNDKIEVELLEGRRAEKDFLLRNDTAKADKQASIATSVATDIESLRAKIVALGKADLAHSLDLLGEIGLAERNDLSPERLDVGGHRSGDAGLLVRLCRIVAEQEILFRTTALQQFDFDLVVQFGDRARVVGCAAVRTPHDFAVKMNSADQQDADNADDADHGYLVSETQRDAPHRVFPNAQRTPRVKCGTDSKLVRCAPPNFG